MYACNTKRGKEQHMTKTEDYLQYLSVGEAFSNQPRKSIAKICDHFRDEPIVFFLIKGCDAGPTVWIQAALHGDEYDGVIACVHLLNSIDVDSLKGNILICPIANPTAFLAGTNASPTDHVNLNRIFHDDRKDSYSYLYGEWLLEHITAHADLFIDLHGGGKYLDVCSFAMVACRQKVAYDKALAVLRHVNLTAVYECPAQAKGMFINEVCHHGIPAILLESGGGSFWTEEGVSQHEESLHSILNQLDMLTRSWEPAVEVTERHHITEIEEIRFDVSGIQMYRAEAGDIVECGDLLLEVLTIPEYESIQIFCPIDKGIVLSIHTASVVNHKDYAVMLGNIHIS